MWSGTQRGDLPFGSQGSIKATGRWASVPDIIVSRISEGKIAEDWESFNAAAPWKQLGALPGPGEAET
jgi:hypothetical protein